MLSLAAPRGLGACVARSVGALVREIRAPAHSKPQLITKAAQNEKALAILRTELAEVLVAAP